MTMLHAIALTLYAVTRLTDFASTWYALSRRGFREAGPIAKVLFRLPGGFRVWLPLLLLGHGAIGYALHRYGWPAGTLALAALGIAGAVVTWHNVKVIRGRR